MPKLYALVILFIAVCIGMPPANAVSEDFLREPLLLASWGSVHPALLDAIASFECVQCPRIERVGVPPEMVHSDPFGLHRDSRSAPDRGAEPLVAPHHLGAENDNAAVIPEPSTMVLLLLGLGGMLAHRRIAI